MVVAILKGGKYERWHEHTRRIHAPEGTCATIHKSQGGGQTLKIMVGSIRGRNPEHPTSRESGLPTEQRLETKDEATANTLTTVQKDCVVVDDKPRIRYLTPLEYWRLMGFDDEDFRKAKAALNAEFYGGRDRSNSQLYKMAGNSIVVQVLQAIFGEMM